MAKLEAGAQSPQKNVTAITGERRQVTAVFYDIVDSTQLLQRLDPEDFALLQRRVHAQAAAAIRGNGGYLEGLHGDGGSAYFGFPVSSEDAAECAVAAGLELVARCHAVAEETDLGAALRVRVGIATGTVIISDLTDMAFPEMKEVIGITPTLAARIQSEAEPNTVAVSDATFRLTRSAFDFQPLGERPLKGVTEPVRLWKPVARRHPIDRFSSSHRALTPLVDRVDELAMCRSRWGKSCEGHGQSILLTGEAGIGKSRLLASLSQEVLEAGGQLRVFQCLPRGNARPFHPFVDTLRREIRGDTLGLSALDPNEIREFLQGGEGGPSDEAIKVMAFLSGKSWQPVSALHSHDLSADDMRRRAVDAIFEILIAWAGNRPQLLIIEDIHWADTLTQAALAEMSDRIKDQPTLAVLTSRDDPAPDLVGGSNATTITLGPLGEQDTPQLLKLVWNETPPRGLASFVHDKSEGVPLFAEELAGLLRERFGDRQSTEQDWNCALHESGIVTLQDLLSARLSSLGEARRVAQVASVIGREFGIDLLKHLVEVTADEPSPDEALEKLAAAGIIQRQAGGATYRFRHVLLQEAAYDSLLKADRRKLHGRIADLVIADEVTAPPDDIVAWHCGQAGRWFEAASYAIRAAEACALRSAPREAHQLLATAENHLSRCDPGPQVDELALQLLATRGPTAITIFGKGSQEARTTYEQGVELCRQRGIEDRERWFPLYWGWWFTSPDQKTKGLRSEVLISDLDQAKDPEVRLQTLHCAWAANFHAGRHRLCMECIERGLALYDPDRGRVSRVKYGEHDANVCGLGEKAQLLWLMGDPQGAEESMRRALEWAETIDHLGSRCHALDNAILLACYRRDLAGAADLARRMRELADEHELPGARAKSRIFAGWATALQSSLSEGLREFEEGLRAQREIGTHEDVPVYSSLWAELLMRTGEVEAAMSVLDRAIEEAEEAGNVVWLPELYRLRASTRQAHRPNREASLRDLEHAAALAESQGAATLLARAREDLGQYQSSGGT